MSSHSENHNVTDKLIVLDDAGDLFLVCTDGQKFRTSRRALCTCSAFFYELFTAPEPAKDTEGTMLSNPIIMQDDSKSFGEFLKLVHGMKPFCQYPSEPYLTTQAGVMEVAHKYGADALVEVVLRRLADSSHALKKYPVFIYGLATKYNVPDIANQAARMTFRKGIKANKKSFDSNLATWNTVPHEAMWKLQHLHQRRSTSLKEQIDRLLEEIWEMSAENGEKQLCACWTSMAHPPRWLKNLKATLKREVLKNLDYEDVIAQSEKEVRRAAEPTAQVKCQPVQHRLFLDRVIYVLKELQDYIEECAPATLSDADSSDNESSGDSSDDSS